MRCTAAFMTAALAFATLSATAARAESDAEIEQVVRRHVQPMLIAAGGMAVALSIDGRTLVLQLRHGRRRAQRTHHSDSLFNLASVGKVFIATLLAQAVKQGEVSLDDPVAKYVTELQQGGDIRKVTLGQLREPHLGLTRTPKQSEPAHRGPYTLADFIRLSQCVAADDGACPRQAGHLLQHRLRAARAGAAAPLQHADRATHGGAAPCPRSA